MVQDLPYQIIKQYKSALTRQSIVLIQLDQWDLEYDQDAFETNELYQENWAQLWLDSYSCHT